jgi:4-hydroxybenzoate polyprenyltransferase
MARRSATGIAEPVPSPQSKVSARPPVQNLIISLRPRQWTKNLIIFAGLLFGQRLTDPHAVARSAAAFVVYCALSGAVYLINDVLDREADRQHPVKARRPVASGALGVPTALGAAIVLVAGSLLAAYALGAWFGHVALAFVLLQALYSGPLKHLVIIDVLTIALGFVLRAVAGAVVIDVPISHWLLVLTIQLALFLALSKRRHEIVLLADQASSHRASLGEYSADLLDQLISIVAASTLIAYAIYSISAETVAKFDTDLLGLTLPFPIYGIFRYLYLVHRKVDGGSPADTLLTDRPLLICVALWGLAVMAIIYWRPFPAS